LLREHVQAALEIAPPGSAVETRALAVHAVLSPGRRSAFYLKAMDAMSSEPISQDLRPVFGSPVVPIFIDSSTPVSARPDIKACLRCAEVMLTLEQQRDLSKALTMAARLSEVVDNTSTILTSAPLFYVLSRLHRASDSSLDCLPCVSVARKLDHYLSTEGGAASNKSVSLSKAVGFLRTVWDTSSAPQTPTETLSRRYSMVSNDTGYASLSELDEQGPTSLTPMANLEVCGYGNGDTQQH
jgi:hypothetical protein